ncbi:protein CHUP1, chloroplastic-like [Neltuma alba]|uniref:protein CHUP1, chloroplastic-like n=1 Tax=Neltuma alba TaxID=207710 RepID=UPI0010A52125|nr:protein CHUP1, chloroplastic-like [Prosopis alba]
MRESRDVKPILLKVGLALTLSIAGYLISRIRIRRINNPSESRIHSDQTSGYESDVSLNKTQLKHDLPSIKLVSRSSSCNSFSDAHFLDTFQEESFIKEVIISNTTPRSKLGSPPKAYVTPEKDNYDQEMRNLKNIIRMLQERETSLKVQLLDYYDLREKETALMELQNRLAISSMEAKMLDLKVESLMSENRRLEAQMADHAKLITELECSKAKAKLLKKRIKHEAEENRELIRNLQQKIIKLQEDHRDAGSDEDLQKKLSKLKDLETEAEELRESNFRLEIENSELAQRLDSTQILANAFLEDPEKDALKEETEHLKRENENLTKEIEQLQADRCSEVEELVYLRWVNACLRYELRNYQPPPGKTVARDLSKSLSPTSEKKAKHLILEYAKSEGTMDFDSPSDQWSSSQTSFLTDADDCSPFGNSSSSVPRIQTSNKNKFFHKLRRLIKGKDSQHHRVQLSPGEKCGSQKSNSPQFCSSGSAGNDTCRRNELDSTPCRIYRSSSDFHRLTILKEEEDSTNSDTINIEKTPLTKYAEALKDSGASSNAKRGFGRRSASYSSF